MAYNVTIVGRAERSARIQTARQSPIAKEKFFDFRNAPIELPVIQLPVGLPVYRMENFRTFTDQRQAITTGKLSTDYFLAGQESESVQQAQHNILDVLARKGGSVTPVIDVLRKDGQREPLLITVAGVVVNGNRRLAAMRELLEEDNTAKVASSRFATVNCAVLPADASAEDILNVEAALQAKPETKLEYDWIGDAQLVSRMVGVHKSTAIVAARLNRPEREIKNVLQALTEADLYLKEWAGAEGEYNRVREDAEQLFKDLPKMLENKTLDLQNASRAIAWTLFDNREKIPGRVYNFNAAFGKLATDVLDRFANDQGISTEQPTSEDDGSFAVDVSDQGATTSFDAVVEALRDAKDDDEVVDALIDSAQTAIDVSKGQKSKQAALKSVGQAHAKLVSVDVGKAAPETMAAIKRQLESISTICSKLLEKIEAATAAKPSPPDKSRKT